MTRRSMAMIGLALPIGDRPLQFIAATIPLVVVFTAILAKTTRGGWRWRWGQALHLKFGATNRSP